MYRIAVTNRHLCQEDFLTRIRRLAEDTRYDAILLREKDMTEREYRILAEEVLAICQRGGKRCILHTFYQVAKDLGHPFIHLPLPMLRMLSGEEKVFSSIQDSSSSSVGPGHSIFTEIGTSVHSTEQAEEAVRLGASYVIAGHVFSTACKPNLPPRGLAFVREISRLVSIPVYGIGGISGENEELVVSQGAKGVCIMSGCMKSNTLCE